MTDEKRKSIIRRIMIVVESCENICEDSSRLIQEQAKIVAYEHIKNILDGGDKE